jgi:hypothetical protein
LVPRVTDTRGTVIAKAVATALGHYQGVMDAEVDFRCIQIDVKMGKNGRDVRTVLISFQGEYDKSSL